MVEIIDGIIDSDKYNASTVKILVVLKEANVAPEDRDKEIDITAGFREDWHKKNALSVPTFRKLIYATYGILNPDVEWSNVPYANDEAYEAVKQIAYININKLPAGAVSNYTDIKAAYNKNRERLIEQIKDINPDVILFGNTLQFFEYEDLKATGWDIEHVEKQYVSETHNTVYYVLPHNKLIINAYHPSYTRITDKIYWEEIKLASQQRVSQMN